MREHPIPQDITNYRFHIIGSMTLKQFAEIFIGVVVGVAFYSTNLPTPIKWAFILLSVGLGAGAAFLPIEERPLDHWIITFFRTLYKPTKFFWKRTSNIPEPFLYEPTANQTQYEPELDLSPVKKARIKEYITSVNTPSEYQSDLTDWEASRIQQISSFFDAAPEPITPTAAQKKVAAKPNLQVRVRSMRSQTSPVIKTREEVTIYAPTSIADDAPIKKISTPNLATSINQQEEFEVKKTADLTAEEAATLVDVPENTPPEVEQVANIIEESAAAESEQTQTNASGHTYVETSTSVPVQETQNATEAAFNLDLPFPDPPEEANKLVGMVLTQNNELITNAIVEIQLGGQIVRAVKTNALGQFFITTPLKNGEYLVNVEKDGFSFTPQTIVLKGEPVAPLEIRSA